MPIYKFLCCNGHISEYYIPKVESEEKIISLYRCKVCSGLLVKKLYSRVSLRFKGDGFYVNDYKGQNNDK